MIPLFRPSCTDEEIEAVTRVMRSGWWAQGPEVEAFEEEFAAYTGSRYAVATNSCTAALELAARSLSLKEGTSAITPALTFVSTASAMQHAGRDVYFADIDEDTLCVNWDSVRSRLESCLFPPVIVPVWYAGTVTAIPDDILEQAVILEDCAHAAGSAMAGRWGKAACWSFQAVKNLSTGDGGMITTNDPEVARKARALRWCGIDKSTWERDQGKYGWDYSIPYDGEKAHMNDLAAAIGRVQLKRLNQNNEIRRIIARWYNREFADLGWLNMPAVYETSANHLYAVRVAAKDRNRFIDHMLDNGVSAGVHYKPLTHYSQFGYHPDSKATPVTNRVWKQLVTLPLFPDMAASEIEKVIQTVKSFRA